MNFIELSDKLRFMPKDMEKFISDNDIEITPYFPIRMKYDFANEINKGILEYLDSAGVGTEEPNRFFLEYDIRLVLCGFMRYVSINVPEEYITTASYDLVIESGFYDYVLDKIGKDYQRLCDICERVVDVKNLKLSINFINSFNNEENIKATEEMARIINEDVDIEKLKILRQIESFNDPIVSKLSQSIGEVATRDVLTEMMSNKKEN